MHPVKQVIIALRTPIALEIQPEIKPPVKPPTPRSIMVIPRSACPSECGSKLWTQVGIHENIPHKPISIELKIMAPLVRFLLSSSVCFNFLSETFDVAVFQRTDSFRTQNETIASTKGSIPIRKAWRQSDTR